VWDIGSAKVVRSVEAHPSGVFRVWSLPGGLLLSQGFHGPDQFRLWDAETLADKGVLFTGWHQSLDAAIWPDRTRIAYAPTRGLRGNTRIRELPGGDEKVIPLSEESTGLADLAGNADTLIVTGIQKLFVIPVRDPAALLSVTGMPISFVRVSPDGRFFAFSAQSGKDEGSLRVFEVRTAREMWNGKLTSSSPDIAFSPVAPLVVAGDWNGNVRVFNYTSGKELLSFAAADGRIRRLVFSPDGSRLATAGGTRESGCVYIWNVADLNRPVVPKPTAEQLSAWTRSLIDPDPKTALRAAWELIDRPEAALPELKLAMEGLKPPDPKRIVTLITDLASEDFKTREAATAELIQSGEAARKPATEAFVKSESAEQKRRLGDVLDALKKATATPESLFASRCVFVLERIGTKEAIELLKVAVKKGGILAEEATAALARLGVSTKQ
jgi:hypothetical protein